MLTAMYLRAAVIVLAAGCWTAAPPVAAPIANSAPRSPVSAVEHWTGIGHQFDDDSHWEMDLRLEPSARVGDHFGWIEYPSLGCRGELTREPDRDGDLIAREHITDDEQHRCVDGGEMVIPRTRGTTFHWRWRYPSGEDDADAELSRAAP